MVTRTIDRLPGAARAEFGELVERSLTEQARHRHPDSLHTAARQFVDRLDPDGTLADEQDHVRRRDVSLIRNRDGSGTITGRLTPTCLAKWQAVMDPLAAPSPAGVHGGRDVRTSGQRWHDAFEDAGGRLLRSGQLPDCGGIPATVLITMTIEQAAQRRALAITGHGGLLGADAALDLADQAHVLGIVHDADGRLVSSRSWSRLASKRQRLALAARDQGCSFPGCDVPPAWSEAHHIIEWSQGGSTTVDNLTLVCGYHHRHHRRAGWECRMQRGVPEWLPPACIHRPGPPAATKRRPAPASAGRAGVIVRSVRVVHSCCSEAARRGRRPTGPPAAPRLPRGAWGYRPCS